MYACMRVGIINVLKWVVCPLNSLYSSLTVKVIMIKILIINQAGIHKVEVSALFFYFFGLTLLQHMTSC